MRIRASFLVTVAALATGATVATAQSGGPSPQAPTQNKALPAGKAFTFKVKDARSGAVFITVSTSKKKKADGTLRKQDWFRKMAKKGSVHSKKTDLYPALTDYFLNKPGTYYWQAYRIDCSAQQDCNVEGPVRTFRIR